MLHHPYDSFNPMVDFLRQAGNRPGSFCNKAYTIPNKRGDSPIVKASDGCCSKREAGTTAMVELKARFDEEANEQSSVEGREEVGVHVVYGLAGLKTHCKCCLVVRREGKKVMLNDMPIWVLVN